MSGVLRCLEKYGERLDTEIAEEIGVALAVVRERAADLASAGALITCSVTRFEKGGRIDGFLYRVAGYMPPAAPGRRAKPKSPVVKSSSA